jgi:hypothetical protein
VHGFGFSFALREQLQFAGTHLLTSLLAFNVGVEIAQVVVIVSAATAVTLAFRRSRPRAWRPIVVSAGRRAHGLGLAARARRGVVAVSLAGSLGGRPDGRRDLVGSRVAAARRMGRARGWWTAEPVTCVKQRRACDESKRNHRSGLSGVVRRPGRRLSALVAQRRAEERNAAQAPAFEVDPLWPKPLPNHWVLGSTIGVSVDENDHVWDHSSQLRHAEQQREGARAEAAHR